MLPQVSVSDYVSDYEMHRRREHEIRLGPSLLERIYKSLRTRATERKEMGVPTSIAVDGCRLGARLRIRDDELPTMKVTLSRTRICPAMTLCSSLEVTVGYSKHSACDNRFSLIELLLTMQEYNVVIHSKVVSHVDWILRCDCHTLDRRYTAELEFTGENKPVYATLSSALSWLHSNFGHERLMAPYLPSKLVYMCRISTTSVLDILYPTEVSCKYQVNTDGDVVWIVEAGYM